MGSTRGTIGHAWRGALAVGVTGVLVAGLAACAGDSDDDAAATEATASADEAALAEAPAATAAGSEGGGVAETGVAEEAGAAERTVDEATGDVGAPLELGDPLSGRDIAVEARVSVTTDDVRATVDGITAAVADEGGMIAQADVDYAPEIGPDDRGGRATIVVRVPPAGLGDVVSRLADFGIVTGFEQFAEDVTDQVADLDTRIDNQRASVARLRTLLGEAANVDVLLKVEAQLTDAELELERLLAAQRNLGDRVAMSTLTIDVVPSEVQRFSAVSHRFEPDRPGVSEALRRGWDAFVGALFAVVLVLAVGAPFIAVAVALLAGALLARRVVTRRPGPPEPEPAPAPAGGSEAHATASRPE